MNLLYLTNIPTPYRNKRFEIMNKVFSNKGINVEVFFMRYTENNRHWKLEDMDLNFKNYIDKGIYFTTKSIQWHLNPNIIKKIYDGNYDIVIVGGIASPTHWIVPYFLKKNQLKLLSVESNVFSERRKNKFARVIKKTLFKKYDAYQITGERADEYLKNIDVQCASKPRVVLPNLINEDDFVSKLYDQNSIRTKIRDLYRVGEKQLWICPARLIKIKGLDIFFPALKNIKNVKLIVAGDGPDRDKLQSLIDENSLDVELIGNVSPNNLADIYAASDLFVLPSLEDASPLSPIEASFMGLPLLISNKIGNLPELYYEETIKNSNGWSFDPYDTNELKELLISISSLSHLELKEIGNKSRMNYNLNFEPNRCIEEYCNQLIDIYNSRCNK